MSKVESHAMAGLWFAVGGAFRTHTKKTHISADLLRLLLLSILNAHQNYVDNISLAFMQKSI